MRAEVYAVLTGMQDALIHAGLIAVCVPIILLAVVFIVLKLDEHGWLP